MDHARRPDTAASYYRGRCAAQPECAEQSDGHQRRVGDEYEYYLAWQWVDITGLAAWHLHGSRSMVDPYGFFLEQREDNQCA